MPRVPQRPSALRCLIIERHAWETGAASHQLQLPLGVASNFFGQGARTIRMRLAKARQTMWECDISAMYGATARARGSNTRRINRLPWLGFVGHCFVFIEETDQADIYDFWVNYDVAIVAANFDNWQQATVGGSGRGGRGSRGRLWNIVNAPVAVEIARLG